jgi:hypothetical protein
VKQFVTLNGKQMSLGMLVKKVPNEGKPQEGKLQIFTVASPWEGGEVPNEGKPQEGKLQIFTVASPWEGGRGKISMIQREAYTEPSYILRIDTIAHYSDSGIDWLFDPKKLYLEMQRIILWCGTHPEAVNLARTSIAHAIDQAFEDPQVGPERTRP